MSEPNPTRQNLRTVQDLAFVASMMCRLRLQQLQGQQRLSHASEFVLDDELAVGLQECGYVADVTVLTEEAAIALSAYLDDVAEIMYVRIRPNDMWQAQQFHQQQEHATPFYQLWNVLSMAVTFANALPLGVEAINQASALLSPPSNSLFGTS